MYDSIDKIAHIMTGYVGSTCCHKTGGHSHQSSDCHCREVAADILKVVEYDRLENEKLKSTLYHIHEFSNTEKTSNYKERLEDIHHITRKYEYNESLIKSCWCSLCDELVHVTDVNNFCEICDQHRSYENGI